MKLISGIAAALVVMGGGAHAQDLQYSPQATSNCLQQAPASGEDPRRCIGRSAMTCTEATGDGSTTVGMGYCWEQELNDWDTHLNKVYQYALGLARDRDNEMRDVGSSVPSLETTLRDAQRAWITWRDATCDFEMAQWGGGTGGGPALLACLTRVTGEQALYLEQVWLGE